MATLIQLHPSLDSFQSDDTRGSLSVRVHPAAELSAYLRQFVDEDVPRSPRAGRSTRLGSRTLRWALRQFRFSWSGETRARPGARRSGWTAPPSGDANRAELGSLILPGRLPDRAAPVLHPTRAAVSSRSVRSPGGDPTGGKAPGVAPNCATLYCARHAIRPHQFVEAVFWKTLFPHARWFGFPLIAMLPWAFARDRDFLAEVGCVRTLKQYAAVEEGFHRWSEPRSLLRGVLRLRVSTRRVRRLVEALLARPR